MKRTKQRWIHSLEAIILCVAFATVAGIAAIKSTPRKEIGSTNLRTPVTNSAQINRSLGQALPAQYSGRADWVQALQSNQAKPLAIAAVDFDGDGLSDLINGYAIQQSGLLTLHRGTSTASNRNGSALTSAAEVFASPTMPEFLGAGDFNGDGRADVVVATRGSAKLLGVTQLSRISTNYGRCRLPNLFIFNCVIFQLRNS